tara:strand:+ start:855 stop:1100 length:246 start_codon:yes stop_codon:yes gene_type:complete
MNSVNKQLYQQNYYTARRDYVINLLAIPSDELSKDQLLDLNKLIKKYKPKSARFYRKNGTTHAKGPTEFKIENKQVMVRFD